MSVETQSNSERAASGYSSQETKAGLNIYIQYNPWGEFQIRKRETERSHARGRGRLTSVTSEELSTSDAQRFEQRKTFFLCTQPKPNTREQAPTEAGFCIDSASSNLHNEIAYSLAGTALSDLNVNRVFKLAVFSASVHLINTLSDTFIITHRFCHILQDPKAC